MTTMNNPGVTRCGKTEFHWGEKTYVMGVINVSPDSFSGDGLSGRGPALALAERFTAEGADILDVGGETTHPGAAPITGEEELRRVVPVIEYLAPRIKLPISVDTYKYEVARQALQAGAAMLNDQWALRREPRLGELAAEKGVPIILMSNQREKGGYDAQHQSDTGAYEDIMTQVILSLKESLDRAISLGVPMENIILDPGIGFGKKWEQNLELIRRLGELKKLGRPILVGPSRKSFIGIVLNLPASERLEGTAAAIALSIAGGADVVRVHDVREMVRVSRMSDAIIRGYKQHG
ncbi:MAG: dihydropteroate synthase [Chloroflexota bacterium]